MKLTRAAQWPGLRALAWHGRTLYASRGYTLLRGNPSEAEPQTVWKTVGRFNPVGWRRLTSRGRLTARLCRDGFGCLAVLSSGHLVAAVPGNILRLPPGDEEFLFSCRVLKGTRPLKIAVTDKDHLFWGEYFDNPRREEVRVYGSEDRGETWRVVHAFPKGTVRHIHNIVFDPWGNCLWVLTGDEGAECRILRASCDWKTVEVVLQGNQQARAVAFIPTPEAFYFASDTPLDSNYVYRMDRRTAAVERLAPISGSSLCGATVGDLLFFSTAVEPSRVNLDRRARLYGSGDGRDWHALLEWRKDPWPMRWFQYGNLLLPSGDNRSGLLALTGIALKGADSETTLWRIDR